MSNFYFCLVFVFVLEGVYVTGGWCQDRKSVELKSVITI